MQDNGIIFLACSGQEAGDIHKANNRNIESITESYKPCALATCIYIKHTGIGSGLVGHNADALTVEACKAGNDVFGKLRLHFEELIVIGNCSNYLVHIICLVRIVG